ncbi:MAG: antibiotic biosynthesis monooxygenase [Desulfurellaceae bacterium]|nr:antibiotic biosynthesis monooxygenase [Desulfurellaceae bacterium]
MSMVVVTNRIPVAKGHEADFEERFRSRAGLIDTEPGFIRNEILRPIKGDYYLVKTYWRSQADFERWTKSDSFRQAHSRRPPADMFAGSNVLEIHKVIQESGVSLSPENP